LIAMVCWSTANKSPQRLPPTNLRGLEFRLRPNS